MDTEMLEPLDEEAWRLVVGQKWPAAVAALQAIKQAPNLEGFMSKMLDSAEPLADLFGAVKGFGVPTSDKARKVKRLLELACEDYLAAMKQIQNMARDLQAGANKSIARGGLRGRMALMGVNSQSNTAQLHLQKCFKKFGQVEPFFDAQPPAE